MLNDQVIIENTHFREEGDALYCYTLLPGDDKFEQKVTSADAVRKNMIGWCNTVRDYIAVKEAQAEEERAAKKQRRKAGLEDAQTAEESSQTASTFDPLDALKTYGASASRTLILQHYDWLQERIDELGAQIDELKKERDEHRDERDKLGPIITVWRGE